MSQRRVRQHQRFAIERQPASSRDRCVHRSLHGRGTVSRTAQRHQLRCVFDSTSPEDLFLPSQGPGQSMCALFLRYVCKSWTSGHTPVDLRSHDIGSDCFLLLHPAHIRAGTLVARSTALRQTNSTAMLPQVAGLIVNALRCTQSWPVHATPVVITLALTTPGVFDDSVLNSPHVVWQLHLCSKVEQRLLERCESDHCVVTCAKSVTSTFQGNVDHCQLFDAKSHSLHWENTCRSI